MGVGSDIRKLGHFLEEFEGGPGTVRNVEFAGCADSNAGLTADVELTVPAEPSDRGREGVAPAAVEFDADGRLRLVLESTEPVVPSADPDLEMQPEDATVDADGTITVTLGASVPAGSAPADGRDETGEARAGEDRPAAPADDSTGADRDVPPFEDRELLAAVYDSCETFAEMAEAIEMDVTAETVRRYMIDHGIHEPNSYDTNGDGTDDADRESVADDGSAADDDRPTATGPDVDPDADRSPVVLTDGIGLPEDVGLEALVEAVSRSNTIYEVRREIGLEREETLELLRQLNLTDLVVGRMASEHERDIGREQVLARLRDASTAQPRPRA